jgi:hypothetical protein
MSVKPARLLSVAVVTAALVATATVAVSAPHKGDTITVRKFSAEVMAEPKFFGKKVKTVERGEFLTFVEAKGDWYQVDAGGGATGWIHKSGVEDKKVTLSSKDKVGGSGASRDEVELAGRGFTPEVEAEYKTRNPTLDFTHVDAIEKYSVPSDQVAEFIAKGKLNLPGGEK